MCYDIVMSRVDKVKEREYQAEWYLSNKYKVRAAANRRSAAIQKMVLAYKDVPCMDCGGRFPPCAMDLDHRDPTTKLCNPGRLRNKGWRDERVIAELNKCDPVCANCHRIRTHMQV